ncbi:MAG: response regulator [Treponema sp.]|nr:response regulator [Treponema sp.]
MIKSINSRKVILLVDDDEAHLLITELSLKDEYIVFKVKSGEEVLEFLNESKIIPDLILLDVIMPKMDGWTVFSKIREIEFLKSTPVMFYTTLDEESAKERAHKLGAFDYITKPCGGPVLLNKIRDALHKL